MEWEVYWGQEIGKQDGQRDVVVTEASPDPVDVPELAIAPQTHRQSKQGFQAFAPLYQSVIGWLCWGESTVLSKVVPFG